MSQVDSLQIVPAPLTHYPKQLVNNWSRKVDVETAYRTSVKALTDGTEYRKGLQVRPRRFLFSRLTAMDQRDCSQLTTFIQRMANEPVPIPLYSDVTNVDSFQDNVFLGDFSNTRFFVGARLLLVAQGYCGVEDVGYYTIEAVADDFVMVTEAIVDLGGSVNSIIPTLDVDIELASLQETLFTDDKFQVDINVNENIDESALVPLTSDRRTTLFEDDFNDLAVDPVKWPVQVGSPSIVSQHLNLQNGDSVTSEELDRAGSLYLVTDYTINTPVVGEKVAYSITLDFNANQVVLERVSGGAERYDVKVNASTVATASFSGNTDSLQFVRRQDSSALMILGTSGIIAYLTSDIAGEFDGTSLTAGAGADVDILVNEVEIYDLAMRLFEFNPDTFEGYPIFDIPHNWSTDPTNSVFRYGTKVEFGRGRLVEVDSDRPQMKWGLKSSMSRAEAFYFLRFFDWARGRLAPFFFVNPQTLWEIVELRPNEIVIKGSTESVDDIMDFFEHVAIKVPNEDPIITTVAQVTAEGDNFVILTGAAFDESSAFEGLTSAHLVRFAADAIREVWTNREVCEVSYTLIELLSTGFDSIWGGPPSFEMSDFVFGGFPDTVYTLNGYFGGTP